MRGGKWIDHFFSVVLFFKSMFYFVLHEDESNSVARVILQILVIQVPFPLPLQKFKAPISREIWKKKVQ